ncbi:MAG: OadG family protein [Tannerellaceae bacterium]|jgi:oxaloacetate decarboxylase gamma subunit|nr:OadG family protein [Tannerellaceae bacterium]
MENLEIGLLLMVVGMATVYVILLIVIYLGKGLITLVNKYAPEETTVKKQVSPSPIQSSAHNLSGSATAAIVSAVSLVTAGKGNVTKIEKL